MITNSIYMDLRNEVVPLPNPYRAPPKLVSPDIIYVIFSYFFFIKLNYIFILILKLIKIFFFYNILL